MTISPQHEAFGFRYENRAARRRAQKKARLGLFEDTGMAEIFSPSFTGPVYVPGFSKDQSSTDLVAANMADVVNACWGSNRLMYGATSTKIGGNPKIDSDVSLVPNALVTTKYAQGRLVDWVNEAALKDGDFVANESPVLTGVPTAPEAGFSTDESVNVATKGALSKASVMQFWAGTESPAFRGSLKWDNANKDHPVSYAEAADIVGGFAGKAHIYSPEFTGSATITGQESATYLSGDLVPTTKNALTLIDKAMSSVAASNDMVGHASSSWIDIGDWQVFDAQTLKSTTVSQTYAELMTNSYVRADDVKNGYQVRVKSVTIIQNPYSVTAIVDKPIDSAIEIGVAVNLFMAGWLTVRDTDQFIPLSNAVLPEGMSAPQSSGRQSDFAFATTQYVVDALSLVNPDEGHVQGLEVETGDPKGAGQWAETINVRAGNVIFSGSDVYSFPVQSFSLSTMGESPFLVPITTLSSGWYAMYAFVRTDKTTFCRLSDSANPWGNAVQSAALDALDAVAAQWVGSVYYDKGKGFFPQMACGDTVYYPIKQIIPTGKFISSVMWKGGKKEKAQILSSANEPFDLSTPAKMLGASWIISASGKCTTDVRIKDYSSISQEWTRIGANILPTAVRKSIPLPAISTTFPAYTIPEDEMKFSAQVLHPAKIDNTLARAVDCRHFRAPVPASGGVSCLLTTPLVIRQGEDQYVATPRGKLLEPDYKGWEVEWLEIALFAVQFIPFGKCASLVGAGAGRLAARAGLAMGAKAEVAVVESLLRSEAKTIAVLGRNIETTAARIVAENPALPRVMVKAGNKHITAFENALLQRETVAAKEARYQFVETAYSNKNIMSTTDFSARDFMMDELGIFDDKNALSAEAQKAIYDIGSLKDIYAPGYNVYKYRINSSGVVDSVVFNDDLRVRIATKYSGMLASGAELTVEQIDQLGKMKNALDFLEDNVTHYRPKDGYIVAPGNAAYGSGFGADSTATPFVENISRYQKYMSLSKNGNMASNAVKNKAALDEYIAWATDHNANYGTMQSLTELPRSKIGNYSDITRYVKEGMETSEFGELMFVKTLGDGSKVLNIEGNALMRASVVGKPVVWGRLSLDQQEKIVRELWAIRFNMQRLGWGERAYVDAFGAERGGVNYIPSVSAYPEAALVEVWDNPILRDFEIEYPADTTLTANMTAAQNKAYIEKINKVSAELNKLMVKARVDMVWGAELVRGFAPYKKFRIANDLLAAQYPEASQTVNLLNTVSFKDASVLNVRTELDRAFYMSNNKVYVEAARTNVALRNAAIGRFDDGASRTTSRYAGADPYYWKVDNPVVEVDVGNSPFGTAGNVFDADYASRTALEGMPGYQELNPADQALIRGQHIFMDTNTANAIRNRPPVRAIPENIISDVAGRMKEAIWNPLVSGSRRWAIKAAIFLGVGVAGFYGGPPVWDYITRPKDSPEPGDNGRSDGTASTPNNKPTENPTIFDGATMDVVKDASLPSGYGRVKFSVMTDSYSIPRAALSFYKHSDAIRGDDLSKRIVPPYAMGRVKPGLRFKNHHRY